MDIVIIKKFCSISKCGKGVKYDMVMTKEDFWQLIDDLPNKLPKLIARGIEEKFIDPSDYIDS